MTGIGINNIFFKRFSRIYGPELVVNGGFDADSDWQLNGATISGGALNIDGTNTVPVRQLGILTASATYTAQITVVSFTAGVGFRLLFGGGGAASPYYNSPGTYTVTKTAIGTNLEIDCRTGETGSVDNVSVKEIL